MKKSILASIVLIIAVAHAEDSLQGALNAVNRRQRDLSEYRGYDPYGGNYNNWNEDVSYDLASKFENRKAELEKSLIDYLENQQDYLEDETVSSPFRERENSKSTRPKNNNIKLLSNFREPKNEDDYAELLDKYQSQKYEDALYPATSGYKRSGYDYNSLGLNSVGLRKRRPYPVATNNDYMNLDDADAYLPYGNEYMYKPLVERRMPYYPVTKRFPVAKRSNSIYETRKQKQKRTDPKVEKELNQIFGVKQTMQPVNMNKMDEHKMATKKPTVTTSKPKSTTVKTTQEVTTRADDAAEMNINKEKPLQMKKKSIKWSDYFGLDRRKKSSNMDNEWLLERYHKANDVSNAKKSVNKQVDEPSPASTHANRKESIEKLDEKLKNIEESIIDDTLKYTGAHDDVDSKEMQEVKDSIISRLATAYNVEKMRKALSEYRQSLERRQREWDQQQLSDGYDDIINEEKRVAVARKQAVDDERNENGNAEVDNNIKCTSADVNCNEQNDKVPREFLEQSTFEKGDCEKIERACKEVSLLLGTSRRHGKIFETACNMHQMCMMCSDNSWFSPTRQCNILFLAKADQLCEGNINCQRAARESIKYLQHVNRTMFTDLNSACHLECPDRKR